MKFFRMKFFGLPVLLSAALLLAGACNGQEPKTGEAPACKQTPDPGPCKALIVSFYFDTTAKQCREFSWGGCKGVRPFESLEDCKKACE